MEVKVSDLKSSKILVVDDNQVNLNVIEATLHSLDYHNITCIKQPLDLIKLFEEQSFDLVLLDINMPLMDGFAVLALMQQMLDSDTLPPVIMLTAQVDEESRVKALEGGASDYITKPFNRIELLKRVSIHLENHHAKRLLKSENDILDQKVRERTAMLEKAKLEIIYRLGRAAEYRDNETGNHVKRVSLIAEAIAEELGQDREYCQLIKVASPMHDVGKIGVSDTILLKPGKLTDEEFILMKGHVKIGAEILSESDSPMLKMAYQIALTHHEKFNGTGYPHGLKGQEIPLCGRIVGLADVFDALTSERPYKKAWSTKSALELILQQKGEHFDPDVVEAFLKVFPKVEAIATQFVD
ncbi:HD domain-containing phosphohydrolase [Thiomicrorhabdus sediminis]|uniref:Response regulator n=1 Tax=Thiomicrorhabdus sediminis TaxID=2580412 RepID=A0A4P9K711_9GAMM|nr:HD domain-containing phosphohydrolase [Thiomicrorhabdus sediminis]QCU90250.1 response regulator [Thiomicrorhabdus sediminis]